MQIIVGADGHSKLAHLNNLFLRARLLAIVA